MFLSALLSKYRAPGYRSLYFIVGYVQIVRFVGAASDDARVRISLAAAPFLVEEMTTCAPIAADAAAPWLPAVPGVPKPWQNI